MNVRAIKQRYLIIANTIVVLLVVGIFFLKPGYLFFTDYVVGPHVTLDPTSGWFLFNAVFSLLSHVIPAALIEKFLLAATAYLLLFSGNRIAGLFSTKKAVVFLSGLFALFNPFVYERIMYGQIGVVLGLAFFMLDIVAFVRFLEERQYPKLVTLGLFWGLAVLFSNQFLFFIVLAGVVSAFCFFPAWKEAVGKKRFWKNILAAVGICILINGTWLGATIVTKGNAKESLLSSITRQDLVSFQMSGNTVAQSVALGAMMSGFWGKDQHRFIDTTQVKTLWGRGFIIVFPIIGVGALLLLREKKRRRLAIFMMLLFAFGLFFALGVKSAASGAVTLWLFSHIPFYVGMRETGKWIGCVVLAYAMFLPAGLDWLYDRCSGKMVEYAVSLVVACAIIVQAPYLLFGFAGQVHPVPYPNDWKSVDRIISQGNPKCDASTLFLPWHMYMSFSWMREVVQNPANQFFSCPVLQGANIEWDGIYDNSGNPTSLAVEQWIVSKGLAPQVLLGQAPSIGYIIVAKDADWNEYSWVGTLPHVHLVFDGPTLRLYRLDKNSL